MSKPYKTTILKVTPEERELIAKLTAKPVFERLDKGESEIVTDDDWSDVPELKDEVALRIPRDLYQKIVKASKKRSLTPEQLAARWLADHVKAA